MTNSKPIRILVADDHFMVRMGLSASLNVEPDMEVVAEAANAEDALRAVFHRVGHGSAPLPVKLEPGSPWEQYDGALVRTEAILLDRQVQPGAIRLLFRNRDSMWEASLPSSGYDSPVLALPSNSSIFDRSVAIPVLMPFCWNLWVRLRGFCARTGREGNTKKTVKVITDSSTRK